MIDERNLTKKVHLKSLYGDDELLQSFIVDFKAEFKSLFID